jgi:hypothetical protein
MWHLIKDHGTLAIERNLARFMHLETRPLRPEWPSSQWTNYIPLQYYRCALLQCQKSLGLIRHTIMQS